MSRSMVYKIRMGAVFMVKIFVIPGLLSIHGLANFEQAFAHESFRDATYLKNEDFKFGTYIIDKPGVYRLVEDISFNRNSFATLTEALSNGNIPQAMASALQLNNPGDFVHPLVRKRCFIHRDVMIAGNTGAIYLSMHHFSGLRRDNEHRIGVCRYDAKNVLISQYLVSH